MSDWLQLQKMTEYAVWSGQMIEQLEDCVRIMARKQQEDAWKFLKILEEK